MENEKHFYDDSKSTDSEETLDESSTVDLDDLELLTSCSREDLFMLIKEDPEYYLKLIKDNALENQLNILIRRSSDGNSLHIKFKIYPDDRWTEVGYWDDATDKEVYADFKDQVGILLSRSRKGRKEDKYAHLGSQLDSNNNMLDENYGDDIEKIRDLKQKFTLGNVKDAQLIDFSNEIPDRRQENMKRERFSNRVENLADELDLSRDDKPIDFLNTFTAGIIEKIIQNVPSLVDIDKNKDYTDVLKSLNDMKLWNDKLIPESYTHVHENLISSIKGCQYIQNIHHLTDWSKYPELNDYLVDFHRDAMKRNPKLYLRVDAEKLEELLDEDDREILKSYCLDVTEIWKQYLFHQD